MWAETDQAPVPHWNVLVCVWEEPAWGSPAPFPRNGSVLNQEGLCVQTPQHSSHTPANCNPPAHCSGWGGQHLQADCSIERPIEGPWPALDPGLVLLEHRVLDPGTQKGRAGQALGGQGLCFVHFLYGSNWSEEDWEDRSSVQGLGWDPLAQVLNWGSVCP